VAAVSSRHAKIQRRGFPVPGHLSITVFRTPTGFRHQPGVPRTPGPAEPYPTNPEGVVSALLRVGGGGSREGPFLRDPFRVGLAGGRESQGLENPGLSCETPLGFSEGWLGGWKPRPRLRIPQVFRGVGLEVEGIVHLGVGADDLFEELVIDGVVLGHVELFARFHFDGEIEGPLGLGAEIASGTHAEDFRDFEKAAAAAAHHFLQFCGIHFWFEPAQDDVIDHCGLRLSRSGRLF